MSDAKRYNSIVLCDANNVGVLTELPCLQDPLPEGFDLLSIPGGVAALLDDTHPWAEVAANSLDLLVSAHELETLMVVGDESARAAADQASASLREKFGVMVETWTPSKRAVHDVACCVVLCADGRQYRLKEGLAPKMLPELYLPSTAALVIPGGPHIVARTQHGHLVHDWYKSFDDKTVPVHGICHKTCAMYAATGVSFEKQDAAFSHDMAGWLRIFNGGSKAGVVGIDERNVVTGIDWHASF